MTGETVELEETPVMDIVEKDYRHCHPTAENILLTAQGEPSEADQLPAAFPNAVPATEAAASGNVF
jgi:hypothetical protein